jgi:formylglycine-generating enzyme
MSRSTRARPSLADIEVRVCQVVADQAGLRRADVGLETRLVQDLNMDSLAIVELVMAVEDEFRVSLPEESPDAAYKEVFTRPSFRVKDLAELVYLRQQMNC